MIDQPTLQDYLDDMHAFGIPSLFQLNLSARERAAGIRKARQELGRLRTELVHHRGTLNESQQALSADERKRISAPFNLLLLLHEQLADEVNALEQSLSSGKTLPPGLEFGRHIFGDEQSGEWFVGSQEQFNDWQNIQQFKQRLDALKEKGRPLRQKLGEIRAELETLGKARQKIQRRLDKRHKRSFVLRRILLLIALAIASGAVGYYYFNTLRDFSTAALGLAAVCVLLMPIVILNWKTPRTRLAAKRRRLETKMRSLQEEGNQLKQRYQPLELQIKALEVHYTRMRDTWEEARLIKQRLDAFIEEGQPLREQLNRIRTELDELKPKREKLQRRLNKRQKRGAFASRMIFYSMLTLMSGGVGFYLDYMMRRDVAAVSYGLAAFFILLIPLAYIDRERRNMKLESALRQMEARMRRLQNDGKQIMKRYHPIELQIKTLIAQYKRLRAGLKTSVQTPYVA